MALPEPRARTLYDVEATSLIRNRADVNGPIADEVLDWNFLDAAPWIPYGAGVMDDPTLAGVNSMMSVSAGSHRGSSNRGLRPEPANSNRRGP